MGARGPQPKPTALRVLGGETRPSQINRSEPVPLQGTPKPPRWLPQKARRNWRETVRQLKPMHVLTLADRDMLALYADAVTLYEETSAVLSELGSVVPGRQGSVVANPAFREQERAYARMRSLAREFGMTPAARVSLTVTPDPGDDGGILS